MKKPVNDKIVVKPTLKNPDFQDIKNMILGGKHLRDKTINLIREYNTKPYRSLRLNKVLNNILNVQRDYLQNYDRNMNILLMEIYKIDSKGVGI